MSPAPRRPAAAAPPPSAGPDFGSLDSYSGGFTLPEGKYAQEFEVAFETMGEKATNRQPRLGVVITSYPLDGGEPLQQFLSMGRKAHLSWAPNPETGKGIVAVQSGANAPLTNKSNWGIYLKSLYDSGLQKGTFTNDISVLDGVWVQTGLIPQPEERKGFGGAAKTGEAAEDAENISGGMIPVVIEILDGGKPWENGGGIPEAGQAAAQPAPTGKVTRMAPKAQAPAAAPARRVAGRPAPAPPPAEEAVGASEEEVLEAGQAGATAVLEKPANANGVTKLLLRTGTFGAVSKANGDEMAQAVIETFFGDDAALNTLIEGLGYKVSGQRVVPAS